MPNYFGGSDNVPDDNTLQSPLHILYKSMGFALLERTGKCRFGTFACVSALWPASSSFWELRLRYLCSSVKGIFTLWCYIQLIQKTKNIARDPGIFDCSSLWSRFPFWHIKITLLHQKKTPGQKARKAGSSPFLGSEMM